MIVKVCKKKFVLRSEISDLVFHFTEAISSDEDEIDELGPSYYDRVAELAKNKASSEGFNISAVIKVFFKTKLIFLVFNPNLITLNFRRMIPMKILMMIMILVN